MKPTAFRIYDFKSIRDSGQCELAGDGITVLAGQNESGKTAILTALRDFDLLVGEKPTTADFLPDDRFDACPRVSVRFEFEEKDNIEQWLEEEKATIPRPAATLFSVLKDVWITRDLNTGQYSFDQNVEDTWKATDTLTAALDALETIATKNASATDSSKVDPKPQTLTPSQFAEILRDNWPAFIYFDSFEDTLPRSVLFEDVKSTLLSSDSTSPKKVPQSVLDFITLSNMDVARVDSFAAQDKVLTNYLRHCGAEITGDFLTYWKQKVDGEQKIDLRVRDRRDESGRLQLAFYVYDNSDHYPEQRSKGFLWFLSFYLRLAAAHKRAPKRTRLLLIDEPGTFLHARAQRDVLHLFEDKIAKRDRVIYSTHSPFLIPSTTLHRLRIILNTSDAGTLVVDRLTHPRLRGNEFRDTLSPILQAIGLDISEALTFAREKNLLVEGISDRLYLHAWAQLFKDEVRESFNIFPANGAPSVSIFASLFIGWGLPFLVVLDRDDQGNAAKTKLVRELLLDEKFVVQPKSAAGIEDLFSYEDFRKLIASVDETLTIESKETPCKAIKRQNIDKIILARRYAEAVSAGKSELTAKSTENIVRFMDEILQAWPSKEEKALKAGAGAS